MHRFTDMESTSKRSTAVYSYLTHQMLPLQKKTIKPILCLIDQVDHFSKIAKNECHFPSEHEVIRDEVVVAFPYKIEWDAGSSHDRSSLKK